MGKTEPVLESFVLDNSNYTQEKLTAENASLPNNVMQVNPPSKLAKIDIGNFFINLNNISRIAGINANDSCIIHASDGSVLNACNPPDIQIAPGKNHVIQMTNNFVAVWNKSDILSNKTVLQGSQANNSIYWTNNFFKINQKNDTYDPSITYDPVSHRWFSTLIEFEIPDEGKLMKSDKLGVLVSYSSPDNYKRWTIMKFSPRVILPNKTIYYCPDRPMIHASSDKVLISMTVSEQEGNFCDPENGLSRMLFMAVFNKTELLNDALTSKKFDVMYLQGRSYHYVPVKSNLESEISLVNIPAYDYTNSRLSLIKINGSLQHLSCHIYDRDLGYPKHLPPNAVQKGTNWRLFLADNRILDAASPNNNETWITFHTACHTAERSNNTSCIRLVKFTVDNNSPYQDCENTASSNSTRSYYEGGNATALSNLNASEIPTMIRNQELPAAVSNNILSKLLSDQQITPKVVGQVRSQLNMIIPNLNASEIPTMIRNQELPAAVSNNILSKLLSDQQITPKVVGQVRSQLVSDLMIKWDLDFQIGSDNYYYFYPSLATTQNGTLVVYFGFSSRNNYPSLGLLVINTTSVSQNGILLSGVLRYDPILVKNGTNFAQEETIVKGGYCNTLAPCTRYGDYFSINNDPFDESVLWAAGEYYDDKYFSTVINNIRVR